MPFNQPVFDPANNNFEDADFALGDTTFDLVYAGTVMQTKKEGYLWGAGLAGHYQRRKKTHYILNRPFQ